MKFTVLFFTLLSISFNWTALAKTMTETKDKREAPVSYTSGGHSAQNYQSSQVYDPSQSYQSAVGGHGDASAINIGAGYSIGGAKPSYSFGGHASDVSLQTSSGGLPSSGHATIQLPPITLQPNHGSYVSNDISQLMSQLSQSINSGALSLQPSNSVAEFHTGAEAAQGAQDISLSQYTFPKLPQYSLGGQTSSPSYVSDGKGLSAYGSTGPVLFNPTDGHSNTPLAYATATSGHVQQQPEAATYSFGGSGNALAGYTLGGSGNAFGGAFKGLGGSQIAPSKASFTPSVFLGASVPSDSAHGLSGVSGSYSAPSFGGFGAGQGALSLSSAGHAPSYSGSFGSYGGAPGKLIAPSFGSYKSEGFGGSLDSLGGLSSGGHFASPPGTTYGFPTSSYNSLPPTSATHSASATRPYYVSTPKHLSSGANSVYKSSGPSHSGSKYSFGGHSSSRYSPKDTHGAHSETSYNTIKYSEDLKPRIH